MLCSRVLYFLYQKKKLPCLFLLTNLGKYNINNIPNNFLIEELEKNTFNY